MGVAVKRSPIRFAPQPNRVIARFFMPGSPAEVEPLLRHIVDMPEAEVGEMAARILRSFESRHRDIATVFSSNFAHLKTLVTELEIPMDSLSDKKKLVIGAYFTNEYSIEAAALFNPSAVLDPDQKGVEKGQTRLILSFRATGEGHISSIVFRRVLIDRNGKMTAVKPGRFTGQAERVRRHVYDKKSFIEKLGEMNIKKDVVSSIMDRLGDTFIYGELLGSIAETLNNDDISYSRRKVIESMTWLAESHYEISFNKKTALSERVIFPTSYSETNGIEDARFVRFVDDDGTVDYYATYTAYNGFTILPKLLRTRDFLHFQVKPLHGEFAANKGMALFPRKVGGRYVMLSRVDGINNFLMFSDNLHVWTEAEKFHTPTYPWELVKVGNSGSPLETEHGWLVITHGIGPVREYSIGALLLDLDDPRKVIGSLREPLLAPNESERDGYVPNVVYSCGSIILNGKLIIPYAVSDQISTIATIGVDELIGAMDRTPTG